MTASSNAFAGSTPQHYHQGLGPMFFEPYARDTASRLQLPPGARVLEIAAGTGIVTRHLLGGLPEDGQLVATDIGEPMLAVLQTSVAGDPRLTTQLADACALTFDAGQFDAVVCQFGLMFFADKVGALAHMRRVAKPGGSVVVNVWGSLAENPIAAIAHETIRAFFPADPPLFYETPFGLHDEAVVRELFTGAGFTDVNCDTVDAIAESASAELAARGLVSGSPVGAQIAQRDASKIPAIADAVAARLQTAGGATPMRLPMRARVFTARA
jgi:ubiquinone/menaquinone biosynthesis C-methylase UbiE